MTLMDGDELHLSSELCLLFLRRCSAVTVNIDKQLINSATHIAACSRISSSQYDTASLLICGAILFSLSSDQSMIYSRQNNNELPLQHPPDFTNTLHQHIQPTNQLSMHNNLWKRRPIIDPLQFLPHALILEDIKPSEIDILLA